jgi:hypothetical protein
MQNLFALPWPRRAIESTANGRERSRVIMLNDRSRLGGLSETIRAGRDDGRRTCC